MGLLVEEELSLLLNNARRIKSEVEEQSLGQVSYTPPNTF